MEENDCRSQFAVRKRRQKLAATAFVVAASSVAILGSALHVAPEYWMPVLGGLAAVGLLFSVANWKCPACGGALSTRRSNETCPECGARLE
jgi:rubrerythrin